MSRSATPLRFRDIHWMSAFLSGAPARTSACASRRKLGSGTLLTHLYVLLPVLDDDKHYWVGDDEVAKLLRFGEGWLSGHPQRDLISRRYLKHQRGLVRLALAQLLDAGNTDPSTTAARHEQEEEQLEAPLRLGEQRIHAILATLRQLSAASVLDLGCGEGRLISELLGESAIRSVTGLDVSHRALEVASERLRLDTLPTPQRERITLLHGSLTYRDKRLSGYDAAIAMEVIEHIDTPRLDAFEEVVFEAAKPCAVLITTPNVEYNALFGGLAPGAFRHRDHRFEWDARAIPVVVAPASGPPQIRCAFPGHRP